MPQENKARPPYVQFEFRPVEDREASVREGRYIAKDVAYAIITPQGSKDRIERNAQEWFAHLEEQVFQGRFERDWLHAFKGAYKDWLEGREPVVNGTDIRQWPVASPAQIKHMLDIKIRTVEDLAVANEETVMRLGMGGRALKDKAVQWLESAKSTGQSTEALHALRTANELLQTRNTELESRCRQLEQALAMYEAKQPPVSAQRAGNDIQASDLVPI